MLLKNHKIYDYAQNLLNAFSDGGQRLPIVLNFHIQKNKRVLVELAQEIERERMIIAQTFGEFDAESKQYNIPPEKIDEAQKELSDLFELEQEVNIGRIKLSSLSDEYNLTTAQMEAIMFMIDEEA